MADRAGGPMTKKGEIGSDDPIVLRSDIQRTRSEMSRTVNAIEERLSPAHFKEQVTSVKEHVVEQIRDAKAQLVGTVHEAKENIKEDIADGIHDAKAQVRKATVGRVENMVDDARHMVHDAGESVKDAGSSVLDTIKENPIPAALVAVGLGWLFMSGKSSSKRQLASGGRYASDGEYRYGSYGSYEGRRARGPRFVEKGQQAVGSAIHGAQETMEHVGEKVQSAAGNIADGAREMLHDAGSAVHDVGASASNLVHRVGDRTANLAHDAGATGRRVARRAGRSALRAEKSIEATLRENPLVFGLIAVAVGAAIGLAIPSTEKEDKLLGATKDKLLGKAESMASNALHQVEEKASDALTPKSDEKEETVTESKRKPMPNGTPARI